MIVCEAEIEVGAGKSFDILRREDRASRHLMSTIACGGPIMEHLERVHSHLACVPDQCSVVASLNDR